MSGQIKVRPSRDPVFAGQVRSGEDKISSRNVKSGHVSSGQVTSGQIKYRSDPVR